MRQWYHKTLSVFLSLTFIFFSCPICPPDVFASNFLPEELTGYYDGEKILPLVAVSDEEQILTPGESEAVPLMKSETLQSDGPLLPVDLEEQIHPDELQDTTREISYEWVSHPEEDGESPLFSVQALSGSDSVPEGEMGGSDAENSVVYDWLTSSKNASESPLSGAVEEGVFSVALSQDVEIQLEETPDLQLEDSIETALLDEMSEMDALLLGREVEATQTTNDPYWGNIYWLQKVRAHEAWDFTMGEGITVAVIDTGLDEGHPDIDDQVWTNDSELNGTPGVDDDGNGYVDDIHGWDFVNNDNDPYDGHFHGTHVAGIIAAEADNNLGIAGIAPEAKIMPLKVLSDAGSGWYDDIIEGIRYAADMGAQVINMSLGGWAGAGSSTAQLLREAVQYALSKGTITVAAAGNDNWDMGYWLYNGWEYEFYPAVIPEVISVGATNTFDLRAYFSNFGAELDFMAPGYKVLSLYSRLGNRNDPNYTPGYVMASGTSMASPVVAGAVALLLSQDPTTSWEDVYRRLKFSARDKGASGFDPYYGNGLIDVYTALTYDYFDDGVIKSQWLTSPDEDDVIRYDFDRSGNITGKKFSNGDVAEYYASGNEKQRTQPDGSVTLRLDEDFYGDGTGRIHKEINADGSYAIYEEYWGVTDVVKVKAEYDAAGVLTAKYHYDFDNENPPESRTFYSDGALKSVLTYEITEDGTLQSKLTEYNQAGDKIRYALTLYHENGELATLTDDLFEDGIHSERIFEKRDAQGKALEYFHEQYYADGSLKASDVYQFADGIRTERFYTEYDEAGIVTENFHHLYEYWEDGNTLRFERKFDANGTLRLLEEYDAAGSLIKKLTYYPGGGLQLSDEYKFANGVKTEHILQRFDNAGLKTEKIDEKFREDGTKSERTVERFGAQEILGSRLSETYHLNGKVSVSVEDRYSAGILTQRDEIQYDASGAILRTAKQYYADNGQLSETEEIYFEYGLKTRRIHERFDSRGYRIERETDTYHPGGQLESKKQEKYEVGIKYLEILEQYDAAGTKLRKVDSTFYDNGQTKTRDEYRLSEGRIEQHDHTSYGENGQIEESWRDNYYSYWTDSDQVRYINRSTQDGQRMLEFFEFEADGDLLRHMIYDYYDTGERSRLTNDTYENNVRTLRYTLSYNKEGNRVRYQYWRYSANGNVDYENDIRYENGLMAEYVGKSYDESGQISWYQRVIYEYWEGTSVQRKLTQYNGEGQLTSENYYDEEGTIRLVYQYSYHDNGQRRTFREMRYAHGLLSGTFEKHYDETGEITYYRYHQYEYWAGTSVKKAETVLDEGGTLMSLTQYDEDGNRVRSQYGSYYSDGRLRQWNDYSYQNGYTTECRMWSYTIEGNLYREHYYRYHSNGRIAYGIYYNYSGDLKTSTSQTWYDETGKVIKQVSSSYYADGSILKRVLDTRYVDGNVAKKFEEKYDSNGTKTYDAHTNFYASGENRSSEQTWYEGGKRTSWAYQEYDGEGNRTKYLREVYEEYEEDSILVQKTSQYAGGDLKEIIGFKYRDGKKVDYFRESYHANGAVGKTYDYTYTNGTLTSLAYREYDESGVLAFSRDRTYHANGRVAANDEYQHQNGNKYWRKYYAYDTSGVTTQYIFTAYHANGKADTYYDYRYSEGVETSLAYRNYSSDGTLRIQDDYEYAKGNKTDWTRFEYDAGGTKTRYYRESYHANGVVEESCDYGYADGALETLIYRKYDDTNTLTLSRDRTYHTNGRVATSDECQYQDGAKYRRDYSVYEASGAKAQYIFSAFHGNGQVDTYYDYQYSGGNLSVLSYARYDSKGMVMETRDETYDAEGNRRVWDQYQYRDGSKFRHDYYEYDTANSPLRYVFEIYYGNEQTEVYYDYRYEGGREKTLSYRNYNVGGVLLSERATEFHENGKERFRDIYQYQEGVKRKRHYYEYEETGEKVRYVFENLDESEVPQYGYDYRYEDGVLTSITSNNYDEDESLWRQILVTYDANGKRTSFDRYLYQDGSEYRRDYYEYEYSESSKRLTSRYVFSAFHGNGQVDTYYDYRYTNGRVSTLAYTRYDAEGTVIQTRDETYDAAGKRRTWDQYQYQDGAKYLRNFYTYSAEGSVLDSIYSIYGTNGNLECSYDYEYAGGNQTAYWKRLYDVSGTLLDSIYVPLS